MNKPQIKVMFSIGEFVLLTLLALVAPLAVFIDVVSIGHGVSEGSLTELTQEVLLLMSALCFGYGAWRYPASRSLFVLVLGLFGCMLIREFDGFLDFVWHGFWFWPSILVSILSIAYVIYFVDTPLSAAFSDFVNTKPYFFIIFGLIIVLVFSRVFGSAELLWKNLIICDCDVVFKNALQEGLELFGYVFIAYGSCLSLFSRTKNVNTYGQQDDCDHCL